MNAIETSAQEYNVLRTELIAKLKEIVFNNDRRRFAKHHNLDFYKLLTDSAYRESKLIKLSLDENKGLSALAFDAARINFTGSLLNGAPTLCSGDRVVVYPGKPEIQDPVNVPFNKRWLISSISVLSTDAA